MNTAEQLSKINIGFIPAKNLDKVWLRVSPMIQKVIDKPKPEHDILDVYASLKNEKAWLVLISDESEILAAYICAQADYPRKRIMYVNMMVGKDMYRWKDEILEFLKVGARNIGATEIEYRGRRGFEKMYKDVAKFKHVAITIEVD